MIESQRSGHPESYWGLVNDRAEMDPGGIALIDVDQRVDFAALRDDVARIMAGFATLGVGQGDVVAIWLPNVVEWVEASLAVGGLGAITLGINTKLRSHDVEQLLIESHAKVLVTWPDFKGIDFLGMLAEIGPMLPDSLTHIVYVRSSEALDGGENGLGDLVPWSQVMETEPTPVVDRYSESLANAFTSSGTTGRPKIVLHTQRAELFHSFAVAERFGYAGVGDEVIFAALPLCGVFGFNTLLAGLAAGRPVVLQTVFNAREAITLIEQHRITHLNASDTMLRLILDALDDPHRVASWREAAFGAFTAADPMTLVERGVGLGKKLFQTYGSSESMAVSTYPVAGSGPERWALGGGVPVSPEYEARIRSVESGGLLSVGDPGEIELRGLNISPARLTADGVVAVAQSADGFHATGDLGRLQNGDDVVYLARLGDALRLGGFLVSPSEVESFLGGIPGVAEAQYVAVEWNDVLTPVAFVVAERGVAITEQRILAACSAGLAAFKNPRRVGVLASFPVMRGANGDKVQKGLLRELARELLAERVSA